MSHKSLIRKINNKVNREIEYRKDRDDGYGDNWKLPEQTLEDGYGDCEDFAILKAYLLINEGIRVERIGIARCDSPWGGHAVCIVGDWHRPCLFGKEVRVEWVLDINHPKLIDMKKSPLHFLDVMSYSEALEFCNFDAEIRKGIKYRSLS